MMRIFVRTAACWLSGILVVLVLSGVPAQGTTADDICPPAADPCVVSGTVHVDPNSTIDVGGRTMRVRDGGVLQVSGGKMTLLAGEVVVEAGGALEARGSGSSPGGDIECRAAAINMAGSVDVSGAPAGTVTLVAEGGALSVSGSIQAKSLRGGDDGGQVTLAAQNLDISGAITATGGNSGFGGSVSMNADGDVTVSGDVDVSGGEGGDIDITAGLPPDGAGDVAIAAAAGLKATATAAGGFGGEIDVSANGDGSASGHILLRGYLEAKGKSGNEDTGGGDGGLVSLEADGDILNDTADGGIDASGGSPDGEGGEIDLEAGSGRILTTARLRVRSTGLETAGGEVSIQAGAGVVVAGEVDAVGGGFDGGAVSIESGTGDLVLRATGSVDASSSSGGGFGGDVSLIAGPADSSGTVRLLVNGPVTSDGSGSLDFPGDGGTLEFEAAGDVIIAAAIRAKGASGGSFGGEATVTSQMGSFNLQNSVTMNGVGLGGLGGRLDITVPATATIGGEVSLRGQSGAGGGALAVRAGGAVDVRDGVLVDGTGRGRGGTASIISDGDVTLRALVDASSGGQATTGGKITVHGCAIDVPGAGSLVTGGPDSANIIQGREVIAIAGTLRADSSTGRNEIRYRPGFAPVVAAASITPPAQLIVDPVLVACGLPTATPTTTGSRSPAPTSTPTPRITPTLVPATPSPVITRTSTGTPTVTPTRQAIPSPTATATPTGAEVACVGDCNGNGTVTIDELVRGVNMALGTAGIEQCPPFDGNGDGSVTIDELVRGVNAALSGCPK